MAEKNIRAMQTKMQKSSERLFDLLQKKDLSPEDQQQAADIIEKNPQILSWKDFTAKIALPDLMSKYEMEKNLFTLVESSATSLQTTKQVLDNLQQLKENGLLPSVEKPTAEVIDKGFALNGETLATQTLKNINFLDAVKQDSALKPEQAKPLFAHVADYRTFLSKMYKGDNSYGADPKQANLQGQKAKDILNAIITDRRSLQVEGKEQDGKTLTVETGKEQMPQKTLTLEQLKDKAYQGTLTVDQANQLRKLQDNKKVADMKNQDGDAHKHKREPSNDKFRDEDVIKYMYEDWFLGGASWLFNRVEAAILDVVDTACDMAVKRAVARRQKIEALKDERLKAAQKRAQDFLQMAGNMMNGLGAECKAKRESYNSLMKELKDNVNNPTPHWEHFSPDDPFVKKLEANPSEAQKFINAAAQELENRTKTIEATGKLAMLLTSAQMTDEFMKNQSAWNINNQPATNAQMQAMFASRYQETQKDILKALAVMSEDNRLVAEATHNALPDPKPDLETFTQNHISKQQNNFLKQLTEQAKGVIALQQNELDERKFNNKLTNKIGIDIVKIKSMIKDKIKDGSLYNKDMFKEEHSKERIVAKAGLYEEAMKENSPQSMQKIFEYTKELNTYQLETIKNRRINASARKAEVEKFKNRIEKRNRDIFTNTFGRGGSSER